MNVEGKPLRTLAELARERGRSVGVVTNGRLASPTFGALIPATHSSSEDAPGIAASFARWKEIQIALGGGAADFLPEHKGGVRTDGRDLALEMRAAGYDVLRAKLELENTPAWRAAKILGLFADESLAFSDDLIHATTQPSLLELTRQAIQLLQVNRRGYFLVVEAALVGEAARANQGERVLRELLELDATVSEARAYAGNNALVVVMGRVVPGGLRLNGFPLRNDKGLALLGTNPQGLPALTWSTGPGGSPETPGSEPSAVPGSSVVPVAEDVLVVSSGPGSEKLSGFLSISEIFSFLAGQL